MAENTKKAKFTTEQLKELQSKTLEEKIQISAARIMEWYETWGGQVYVGFSGGKDSTVLLHMVRRIYPEVPAVFSDTGLEFPEVREFVKTFDNVTIVRPEMTFTKVIENYGYPIISKEVANTVRGAKPGNTRWEKLNGTMINKRTGKLSQFNCPKWKKLLEADFKISEECCDIMKKKPTKKYEKETGRKPYLGLMTVESQKRKNAWLQTGCNAFEKGRAQSQPMAFWTEQDVLRYIQKYNIPYASVYGDLIEGEDGKLHFTKYKRTGCVFCGFGAQMEKSPNRFQTMKETHPQLYDYCMRGGKYNEDGLWIPYKGLGMDKVLKYIGVETDYEQPDKIDRLVEEAVKKVSELKKDREE